MNDRKNSYQKKRRVQCVLYSTTAWSHFKMGATKGEEPRTQKYPLNVALFTLERHTLTYSTLKSRIYIYPYSQIQARFKYETHHSAPVPSASFLNAGIISIGVTWGYNSKELLSSAGASYLVNDSTELSKLMKTIYP